MNLNALMLKKVPLLKESVSEAEGTAKVTWSIVKPNTASTFSAEPQNPSNSSDITCTYQVKREKTTKKKKNGREKKRVVKSLALWHWLTMIMSLLVTPSGQTKRARESSDSLSSTTNLPQKRRRRKVAHDMHGGKAKKMTAGTSISTSYVGAVKVSDEKLTLTRKGSEEDGGMDSIDLCEFKVPSLK